MYLLHDIRCPFLVIIDIMSSLTKCHELFSFFFLSISSRNSEYCANGVYITGHSLGGAIASMHAFDVGEGNAETVTFAAPRAGNTHTFCSARRYFLTSTAGDDPGKVFNI